MADVSATLTLRPTRIGFLVRPSQRNHHLIRKVMRVCSCLWGGCFNPIIPVTTVLPQKWKRDAYKEITGRSLADSYIRFFEPDVFVETEPGLAKAAEISPEQHPIGFGRVVGLKEFICESGTRRSDFAHGLNVFDLYVHLYDREFQFQFKKSPSFSIFSSRSSVDAYFDAVFGVFPEVKKIDYIKRAYTDVFEAKEFEPTAKSALEIIQNHVSTLFSVTNYKIEIESSADRDPVIFVFDPTQTVDLIDFWNLRQFRWGVLPVNIRWSEVFAPLVRRTIEKNHRPILHNPQHLKFHTTVEFGRSISEKNVRAFIDAHLQGLPAGSFSIKTFYDPIWRNNWRSGGIQPRRVKLSAAHSDFEVNTSEAERTFQLRALSPEFAMRYGDARNNARWVNVLRFSRFQADADLAQTYLPNVKNPSFPRIGIGHRSIVSREGIVFLQQYRDNREYVETYRQQDAILGWLSERGVKARPSDAGRNAQEIIRSVGGLRRASILANLATIQLLDKMAKTIRETASGEIEQYPDRTASVGEWKALCAQREKVGLLPKVSINHFTDANIIRLGITLTCPHCSNQNWYGLGAIDYTNTCERCLKTYQFPQGAIAFNSSDWRYRVIGPFSKPNFAQGGYSTVLTLRCLRHLLHSEAALTYSTGVEIDIRGAQSEVDFVAWYQEGQKFWADPEPELVFGESKSLGANVFHQRDVDRLRALVEEFPGSYLIFSVLKPALGTDEKVRIRTFAEWGRVPSKNGEPRASIIVLTSNELFASWHIDSEWKKIGGKHAQLVKHPSVATDDLRTLSDITQQLYLDMSPYWDWYSKRRARRTK